MMGYNMMGYGSGWGIMGGTGFFGAITWLVVIVVLVFAGVWLWQQIFKK